MKITVIGSSHGVPEPNRKCTSFLVQVGENTYFVDMGAHPIEALRKRGISVDSVKGIFITHMHGDHTNGLIPFVDLITRYFKTPDPMICLPVPGAGEVIDQWLEVTMSGAHKDIRYRETAEGVVYDDGVLKVTAIPTMHCRKSFAYFVEAEGKRVLFTGDLKHPTVDFPLSALEKEPELVICEGAHFSPAEYIPLFEKNPPKKICATHYQNMFIPGILQLQETMAEKGVPVIIATDDVEFYL